MSRPGNRGDPWLAGAISVALAASALGLYAQTRHFAFITLDDYHLLLDNPAVRGGLTREGVWWALTSVDADWHPLTWLSHMLDFSLFGPEPGPHHLVNAGLHAANAVLLFLALRALRGALWPSALVATLFALHPLRAESVAWVIERKDVLSGLFWMLALLAYAAFARRPSGARYALVALVFVLGLAAKTMLVSLPFVLLLLDVWPLDRTARVPASRLVLEKLPLVACSAGAAVVTVVAQRAMDAVRSLDQMPIAWRLVNATLACCTYLFQTAWPTRLAVFYPHPATIPGARLGDYLGPAAGAAALLAIVTGLCAAAARRRPYLLVGWLWYLVTLLPVVGVVQVGQQAHADRFTYLPTIGVYVMLAWGLRDVVARRPTLRVPIAGAAALAVVALAALGWRQIATWQDSRRLFEHAVAVTSNNYYAEQSLGNVLLIEGELDPARRHLEEALRIQPDSAFALEQLGTVLERQGDRAAAADAYERAVRLSRKTYHARYYLAGIRRDEGKLDEAIELWSADLEFAPDDGQLLYDLGMALIQQQRWAEAAARLGHLAELAPDSPEAHNALGVALAHQGRLDEAAAQFQQTLALSPGHAKATNNLQWLREQTQAGSR